MAREDGAGVVLLRGRGPWPAAARIRACLDQAGVGPITELGPGTWVEDPASVLAEASVIVAAPGQGAVADVATARRPLVAVPAPRPFDEQLAMTRSLTTGRWPVLQACPETVADAVRRAALLDGRRWDGWVSEDCAQRFVATCEATALRVGALQ